jgi:ribosome maturation factor RimP
MTHGDAILAEQIGSSVTTAAVSDRESTMPRATASASAVKAREDLLILLEPVVTSAGFDLEDVRVTAAGRRSLVRVTVDADGGIDLDAVAVVSRLVSDAIDESDSGTAGGGVLAGSYVLEVSSPGIDRPLTEPRHWRRAAGRLVRVDVDGGSVTGRVDDVDDLGVTLDVDGTPRRAGWGELGRGTVQIEFNRADPEPGDQ